MSETDQESILAAPCACGSGKPYRECHIPPSAVVEVPVSQHEFVPGLFATGDCGRCGQTEHSDRHCARLRTADTAQRPSEQAPSLARPPVTRRLDLACGQSPRDGFEGVDLWSGAQHVVDLQKYPWPFEDASVLELNCSHYIEHIPMEMAIHTPAHDTCLPPVRGTLHDCYATGCPKYPIKDALFAFFDECWRILVPDGWLHIVVPAHRSDRAFQDPTHRRFITAQTFAYMNEEWRRVNKLDHYNVDCNFIGDCNPVVDQSLTLRMPEVAQQRIQRDWNVVIDWVAKLQKKPRMVLTVG